MWYKFGHVPLRIEGNETRVLHRAARGTRDTCCKTNTASLRTVGYNPFIKCQLAPHNRLKCVMWCKFGHVPLRIEGNKTLVLQRVVID